MSNEQILSIATITTSNGDVVDIDDLPEDIKANVLQYNRWTEDYKAEMVNLLTTQERLVLLENARNYKIIEVEKQLKSAYDVRELKEEEPQDETSTLTAEQKIS